MTNREKIEIERLSKKFGYSVPEITKMIRAPYEFMTETLKKLDLPRNLTEEEFHKKTKNFNLVSLGKLYASYIVYKKINKL
jgi:hypothetical protein